jgi:uncharacterized iron-regulated membrane protein
MRWMHKWLGLLLALQFLLWMLSGLVMSLLDHDQVSGATHRAAPTPPPAWPRDAVSPDVVLRGVDAPVRRIDATWLLDRPVFRLQYADTVAVHDALSAELISIGANTAAAIAARDYRGDASATSPQWLPLAPLEARPAQGSIWRVDFSDAEDTTLYISAEDGRVLQRRNRSWRWFDVAWMLHIMDYRGRSNFNNPLVVASAAAGVWIALSGVWLLCVTLRLSGRGRLDGSEGG